MNFDPTLPLTMNRTLLCSFWVLLAGFVNGAPTVTVDAPGANTTNTGSTVSLKLNVSGHAGTASVQFFGRKTAPPSPGPDFVVGTLPDTQHYYDRTTHQLAWIYHEQTKWYAENASALNLAFVSHLGDFVGDFDSTYQWENASDAMARLENQTSGKFPDGIPWGGAPGNHDLGNFVPTGDNTLYNQYMGVSRFSGRDYYRGHYGANNNNSYAFFSASGLDFIVIHLQYRTWYETTCEENVLEWAEALLQAYPDRRAIVTSHWILNTGNPAPFDGPGKRLFNALRDNPNLFLLLCGHIHGEGRRTDMYQGHTIHSVLQDYQDENNGGDGWLRYFVFSPQNNTITARTFSPTRRNSSGEARTGSSSQFTLTYDMQNAVSDWVPIGTKNTNTGSTSLSWTGLDPDSHYEWHAVVSDTSGTATTDARRFSTGSWTAPTSPPPTQMPSTPSAYALSKNNWKLLYTDSEETSHENGRGENAFDGNPNSFWHTVWSAEDPKPPHELQVDLGSRYELSGFSYLPRQDGSDNGRIGQYALYISDDPSNWGNAAATGTFPDNASRQTGSFPSKAGRYVRFRALTEVNGEPWSCIAELDLHGSSTSTEDSSSPNDSTPSPSNPPSDSNETWSVHYADSQETRNEDGRASNAIDGDPSTFWHTLWSTADPLPPHEIQIDLGSMQSIEGFTYLPRQDGSDHGRVGQYAFYVSVDGKDWGSAVKSGTFANSSKLQRVEFSAANGRYVRFRALSEVNGEPWTCIAELGVITGGSSSTSTTNPPTSPTSLTGEFKSIDLGTPRNQGLAVADESALYLVEAGGSDIWGEHDEGHFVYREISGDARITLRVDSIEEVQDWSKAGPMMRASTASNSTHVSLFLSGHNTVSMQWRSSTTSRSNASGKKAASEGYWLRLQRRGDTFTSYMSKDGSSWQYVSSTSVPMPSSILVGFAMTAHDTNRTASAFFSNIKID